MKVLYGRDEAEKVLGKRALKDAMAVTKFGDQKAQARGHWWPYCFRQGEQWYVTAESLPRLKGRWEEKQGVRKAEMWARLDQPFSPPSPTFHPQDFDISDPCTTLAIDVEGQVGCITRVSLATDLQCGTYPWNEVTLHVVQNALNKAERVLGWSADYDVRALEAEGLIVMRSKVLDLMTAHQVLNPWRYNGLGKAIGLYVPVQPWKHKMESDPEDYSVMDAAVLIPAFYQIRKELLDRRQWQHYVSVDMPAYWRIREIEDEPVKTSSGLQRCRYSARRNGKEDHETRAAFLLESNPQLHPARSGRGKHALELDEQYGVYRIGQPYHRIIRCLAGEWPSEDELILRMVLGYGPRAAQKGSVDGLPPHDGEWMNMNTLKYQFIGYLEDNQRIKGWRTRLDKQARKDRFVENPFGRRCYGVKAQTAPRWVVESTLADILRLGLDHLQHRPVHVLADGWVLPLCVDLEEVRQGLEKAHWPLDTLKEVVLAGLEGP